MTKKQGKSLRQIIFETVDKDDSDKKLLEEPSHFQYDSETIKQAIEEHVAKKITEELDLSATEYASTIEDTIKDVLKVHHVEIEDKDVDTDDILNHVNLKIVCHVNNADSLISLFEGTKTENPEDEPDEEDIKADYKKVEPEAPVDEGNQEAMPQTTNEEYTQGIISDHGRLIQEAINDYAYLSSKEQILEEYCEAVGLDFKRINQKKLFKGIYV